MSSFHIPKPDLSIIIVTWNSEHDVLDCLESITASAGEISKEVYVVDNASQDGTVAAVARDFPQVSLITNKRNLGFAAANNLAIENSLGRNVLLLNPDTIVRGNALSSMVQYLDANPRVGAVGPKLIDFNGQPQLSCLRYPSIWNTLSGFAFGGSHLPKNRHQPSEVDALSGAALMVKQTAVERVGPLDVQYFMYGEDNDWCYRIRRAGWQIHYLPEAEIVHIKGQSASQVPVETHVRRRIARLLFVQKHKRPWERHILTALTRLNLQLHRFTAKNDKRHYYDSVLKMFDDHVRMVFP